MKRRDDITVLLYYINSFYLLYISLVRFKYEFLQHQKLDQNQHREKILFQLCARID